MITKITIENDKLYNNLITNKLKLFYKKRNYKI